MKLVVGTLTFLTFGCTAYTQMLWAQDPEHDVKEVAA